MTDADCGRQLCRFLFGHCEAVGSEEEANRAKFDCLVHMTQKLYALVQGRIKPDNPDSLAWQEFLLPGHLFTMIFKEKLEDVLLGIRAQIQRDIKRFPEKVQFRGSTSYFKSVLDKQVDVGQRMRHFLVTGNVTSRTGLDLMQVTGFTILADKLNYFRYLSHFRSVHRGSFFTTMKTTTVRKLLPESWGFVCPVHTPDGSPCGLLNHIAVNCRPLTHPLKDFDTPAHLRAFLVLLGELGMSPLHGFTGLVHDSSALSVILDGRVIGKLIPQNAKRFLFQLRSLKVKGHPLVPRLMEICAVLDWQDRVYPCVTLSTTPARVVRPVRYLGTASDSQEYIEYVGPMEQVWMDIGCTDEDFRVGETTHMEISPTHMLSLVSSLTPFSDFNQSPRNMYQCQMGKQTMGTPFHTLLHRTDNKAYRLQTPQQPLCLSPLYEQFQMEEYPLGTNAVVAVISYTGKNPNNAL